MSLVGTVNQDRPQGVGILSAMTKYPAYAVGQAGPMMKTILAISGLTAVGLGIAHLCGYSLASTTAAGTTLGSAALGTGTVTTAAVTSTALQGTAAAGAVAALAPPLVPIALAAGLAAACVAGLIGAVVIGHLLTDLFQAGKNVGVALKS